MHLNPSRKSSHPQPPSLFPFTLSPFGVLPVLEASSEMDIAEECMETVLSYLQVPIVHRG